MSHSRIALVVLFFAALLVPVAPAQAAYTVLCTGYTSCSGKGYSHSGYASAKDTSYWNMYTGTNCTNYIAYRLVTTNGLPNKRPAPGVGNARDWGTAMASVTNSTPAVGAVAWWGKNGGNHVAYIEKVVSDSEIWVSESNWSGAFDWRRITKSGSGWPDGIIHFTPAPPADAAKPAIVGEPRVGTAVKASVGTWNPAPSAYTYQWLVDGSALAGATDKTYTPTSSVLGRSLSVQVTGTRSGVPPVTVVSDPLPVTPGALTVVTRPTLSGTAKVGSRLSATTGTWSRKDVTHSFQWYSGDTAIPGATESSYVARSVDVGKAITARVAAVRVGYLATPVATNASGAVAAGTLTARSAPSIAGTPQVGSRLTASPGTWSPTADLSYQWYAGGKPVTGATQQTFVPTHRERKAAIKVRVVARRAGYTSASATSAETAAVRTGRIGVTVAPTVKGDPSRGAVLTIDPGTVTPAGASVRYQWLRDGKTLSGATGRTRKVSSNDVGHRLSATVTYKATGYSALTVATNPAKKTRTSAKVSVAATPAGGGKLSFVVTVSAPRKTALGGTITVTYGEGRSRIVQVVKGRAKFSLTRQAAGRQTYRLAYSGASGIGGAVKQKTVTVR